MSSTRTMPAVPTISELEYAWSTAAGDSPADFALLMLEKYAASALTAIEEAYELGRADQAAESKEESSP
jgi:hypothetical protein